MDLLPVPSVSELLTACRRPDRAFLGRSTSYHTIPSVSYPWVL